MSPDEISDHVIRVESYLHFDARQDVDEPYDYFYDFATSFIDEAQHMYRVD